MFSKFSEDTQKVLVNAKKEMNDLKHPYIGSEHVFLSLLKYNKSFAEKVGVTYTKFKERLIELVGIGENTSSLFLYTPLLKRVIESVMILGREYSLSEINDEHLLYALLDEKEGVGIKVLESFKVDISELYNYYASVINNRKKGNKKKLYIEEYGVDLTKRAKKGELDPVIGREKELKEIMEILCRRNKNNPLLIGEAGVGKTALVEELARLISSDQVPTKLKGKRIISISMASLVSGTKYRGEFEERVTKMIKELEENNDIYLFIDEIHTIMGAGGAEGAIDAANILKPALARGKIKLIGATTPSEYRKTIDKDKAMERRFQVVKVSEPNSIQTYNILVRLKPLYEKFHKVKIDDTILKEIIDLSSKYIFNKQEPDRSIDVLDDVSSMVSLRKQSNKLDIYKDELKRVKELKNRFLINQDYINASNLKTKERSLITKIDNLELGKRKNNFKSIKSSDVLEVISKKSKIPLTEIKGVSTKYIKSLEKYLNSKVLGQEKAITELINITKRIKMGYKENNKPVSLMFTGKSGIGKTKLALEYSKYTGYKLIKINGSEYKEEASINKLLGSPSGYIGYDDTNKLEEVKNNPNSLILFDEIEKAHPSVLNLFLQILDDGKIENSKGETIHFNNTIIIMTSNIASNKEDIGFIGNNKDTNIREYISIELFNRINKVICFNDFNEEIISKIIKNSIDKLKTRFKDKAINIHINNKGINNILLKSEYKKYGARKIEYIINEYIDTYIIDELIKGNKEIYINN